MPWAAVQTETLENDSHLKCPRQEQAIGRHPPSSVCFNMFRLERLLCCQRVVAIVPKLLHRLEADFQCLVILSHISVQKSWLRKSTKYGTSNTFASKQKPQLWAPTSLSFKGFSLDVKTRGCFWCHKGTEQIKVASFRKN